mmetsp:Transcript_2812/g.6569  ORF Transcript_2812/g.6569 Transcript_2812/m.6569 type:complete len:581 (+) Transcript_2812:894-2636(+)|eukprot:CAMPEP_0171492960 /NCGR_PEP_ID=MMETSP0958-20121227/4704_1 /TAXON_ID=87120 /ORGANISM="Aurantiochytrium limacinum, Strain ATCCMYA-1381" /LENGTH=580 /DNA_ID=CAMNT_0012026545 /DNA_START=847 /DNA_END=2589 /DNA_ORIENTATION=+
MNHATFSFDADAPGISAPHNCELHLDDSGAIPLTQTQNLDFFDPFLFDTGDQQECGQSNKNEKQQSGQDAEAWEDKDGNFQQMTTHTHIENCAMAYHNHSMRMPSSVKTKAQKPSKQKGQHDLGGTESVAEKAAKRRGAEAESLDAKAWLKRRREQIARASRKAREKRKNQVSELQEENDRLRNERAGFLKTIDDLQRKVNEFRSAGQVNVQMENDLLRAQLREHKEFLRGCFQLQHGLPSSDVAFKHLYTQGQSFAQTHVHSILSQSAQESWVPTKFPSSYFETLTPGYNVTACHRKIDTPNNKCMMLRIDFAFKDLSADIVAEAYWRMWSDAEMVQDGFKLDFPVEIMPLNVPGQSSDNFGAWCYSEKVEPPKVPSDWVFVTSRSREDIVKSTLNISTELSPGLAQGISKEEAVQAWDCLTKGDSDGNEFACSQRRRQRRKDATLGTFGKTTGWVLARCTTEHSPVNHRPSARRINSLLVEGGVIWTQGIVREDQDLEANFEDINSSEHLVERESCTRVALVANVPLNFSMNILNSHTDLLEADGTMTERFARLLEKFYYFSRQVCEEIEDDLQAENF